MQIRDYFVLTIRVLCPDARAQVVGELTFPSDFILKPKDPHSYEDN